MYAHGKADDVDGLCDVRCPVTTLFVRINLVDNDIMILLSVRRFVVAREPHFSRVLNARKEVKNLLFRFLDPCLLFLAVSDTFRAEKILPILI